MSTRVSSQPRAAITRRTQSLQLAAAVQWRRKYLLKMTVAQAAEFSGLKPEQWSELEAGWIPAMDDNSQMWIWWSLAGTIQVKVDKLLRLASVDLAREEMFARERAA